MKIFKNQKGQKIGWLDEHGVFRKVVSSSRHRLKVMDAWGIDKRVVDELDGSCKEIKIKDDETGIVYHCTFETFKEIGVLRDFVGEQVFLPLKYFKHESVQKDS